MQIPDYRDAEIEGLIREYKKNATPTQSSMKILEFYGGEDWRTNKGAEMRRCMYTTFSGRKISQRLSKGFRTRQRY